MHMCAPLFLQNYYLYAVKPIVKCTKTGNQDTHVLSVYGRSPYNKGSQV